MESLERFAEDQWSEGAGLQQECTIDVFDLEAEGDSPTTLGTEVSSMGLGDDHSGPEELWPAEGGTPSLLHALGAGAHSQVLPDSPIMRYGFGYGFPRSGAPSKLDLTRSLAKPMAVLAFPGGGEPSDEQAPQTMSRTLSRAPSAPCQEDSSAPVSPMSSSVSSTFTPPLRENAGDLQPREGRRPLLPPLRLPTGPPIEFERLRAQACMAQSPSLPRPGACEERLAREHTPSVPTWVIEEVVDFGTPQPDEIVKELPQYQPRPQQLFVESYSWFGLCSSSMCEEDRC